MCILLSLKEGHGIAMDDFRLTARQIEKIRETHRKQRDKRLAYASQRDHPAWLRLERWQRCKSPAHRRFACSTSWSWSTRMQKWFISSLTTRRITSRNWWRNILKTSRIKIHFLPGYSPNLNLIERLWKFFKKKILYNKYYETYAEFLAACKSFFRCRTKYREERRSLLAENFHQYQAN